MHQPKWQTIDKFRSFLLRWLDLARALFNCGWANSLIDVCSSSISIAECYGFIGMAQALGNSMKWQMTVAIDLQPIWVQRIRNDTRNEDTERWFFYCAMHIPKFYVSYLACTHIPTHCIQSVSAVNVPGISVSTFKCSDKKPHQSVLWCGTFFKFNGNSNVYSQFIASNSFANCLLITCLFQIFF